MLRSGAFTVAFKVLSKKVMTGDNILFYWFVPLRGAKHFKPWPWYPFRGLFKNFFIWESSPEFLLATDSSGESCSAYPIIIDSRAKEKWSVSKIDKCVLQEINSCSFVLNKEKSFSEKSKKRKRCQSREILRSDAIRHNFSSRGYFSYHCFARKRRTKYSW